MLGFSFLQCWCNKGVKNLPYNELLKAYNIWEYAFVSIVQDVFRYTSMT
jgi:hypothetical protein